MRWWLSFCIASVVLFGLLVPRTAPAASASYAHTLAAKKKCHYVTKKVHGKKKRVKVCKTIKKPTTKPTKKPTKTPTPEPTATPSPTPTDTPIVANPDSVTPHTDTSRAAMQTISATGGTLTATGVDGTKYTLTIPADALITPETIEMTPLSALDGSPLSGGLLGGVQLAPDGLLLNKPATLEIDPVHPAAAAQEVSFAANGDGTEFHLYPQQADGAHVTLSLLHFSVHGVGNGTVDNVATQLQHAPTAPPDQAAQLQAAADVATANPSQTQLSASLLKATLTDTLLTQYNTIYLPKMQAAAKDDTVAAANIQDTLMWMRSIAILGADGPLQSQFGTLWGLIAQALQNAYNQAAVRCRTQHNLNEIVTLLSIQRQMAILGQSDDNATQLINDVTACLQFSLDIDVTSNGQSTADPYGCGKNCGGDGATDTYSMDARITGLKLSPGTNALSGILTGQAQPSYVTMTWTQTTWWVNEGVERIRCTASTTSTTPGNPLQATLTIALNPRLPDGKQVPPTVSLTVDPGTPHEVWSGPAATATNGPGGLVYSCQNKSSNQSVFQSIWADIAGAPPKYAPPFQITDWTFAGGEVFATKRLTKHNGNANDNGTVRSSASADEAISLTLHHTPAS